jgi:enoyl-CoA hydratase
MPENREYGPIIFEIKEPGIGVATFNRPDKLNAINMDMIEGLDSMFSDLMNDSDIRVLIITGSGRGFCAGADLMEAMQNADHEAFAAADKFLVMVQERFSNFILGLRRIPQPVIAAVNGPSAGGGFTMAMASDIRLAAPSAYFVCSFINIGLSGGELGSSYFLPRLVGVSRASEIIYTGRKVHAEEAEKIGLISQIVEPESLLDEAMNLAKIMLGKSPGGLVQTKRVLDRNIDAPSLEAAIDMENRNQTILAVSSEFFKQVSAFTQKGK